MSIWQRNYQFTTLSNESAPSTVPKLAIKSPKAPKRLMEAIEESDEDLPTESQNDDLVLKQYMIEPSSKRFKEDGDEDDDEAVDVEESDDDEQPPKTPETTPKRNPFKKSVPSSDLLLSPTRISSETNSLVKNQSPVKQIDYGRLEKLSRFNRTVLPVKAQPVISRFFNTPKIESNGQTTDVKCKTAQAEVKSEAVPTPAAQMKSPNLLVSCSVSETSTLYFSKSNDSGFSGNNEEQQLKNKAVNDDEDDPEDNLSRESQYSIIDKFRIVLKEKMDGESMEFQSSQSTTISDKTDVSETNELPIVLSDNENDIDNSQKVSNSRMWLSGSQKAKTVRKLIRLF